MLFSKNSGCLITAPGAGQNSVLSQQIHEHAAALSSLRAFHSTCIFHGLQNQCNSDLTEISAAVGLYFCAPDHARVRPSIMHAVEYLSVQKRALLRKCPPSIPVDCWSPCHPYAFAYDSLHKAVTLTQTTASCSRRVPTLIQHHRVILSIDFSCAPGAGACRSAGQSQPPAEHCQ